MAHLQVLPEWHQIDRGACTITLGLERQPLFLAGIVGKAMVLNQPRLQQLKGLPARQGHREIHILGGAPHPLVIHMHQQ